MARQACFKPEVDPYLATTSNVKTALIRDGLGELYRRRINLRDAERPGSFSILMTGAVPLNTCGQR